jgi:uncharacterized membrane protein YphA (DoxX/SURF4 family)
MISRLLHWACRLFLGGIFVYAGLVKLANPLEFAALLDAYELLSPERVIWTAGIIPWLEIVLGMALIFGLWTRFMAASAGAFLVFFIVVMLVTYLRGIEADCGCFGGGERISPFTLVRDLLFVLPALYLVARPRAGRGGS